MGEVDGAGGLGEEDEVDAAAEGHEVHDEEEVLEGSRWNSPKAGTYPNCSSSPRYVLRRCLVRRDRGSRWDRLVHSCLRRKPRMDVRSCCCS